MIRSVAPAALAVHIFTSGGYCLVGWTAACLIAKATVIKENELVRIGRHDMLPGHCSIQVNRSAFFNSRLKLFPCGFLNSRSSVIGSLHYLPHSRSWAYFTGLSELNETYFRSLYTWLSKVIAISFGLICITTFCDWLTKLKQFLNYDHTNESLLVAPGSLHTLSSASYIFLAFWLVHWIAG